eukprot:TRINITY_DN5489_c0_g1_i1.p1 TRINITY_DN5489_c0_g1~~TRINITY_DN5489_c0_g1_i1.p1  ORF type:complete len:333 (+),score=50.07 TRINITY_DN5489_c0_g1_i1:77-1000(+)
MSNGTTGGVHQAVRPVLPIPVQRNCILRVDTASGPAGSEKPSRRARTFAAASAMLSSSASLTAALAPGQGQPPAVPPPRRLVAGVSSIAALKRQMQRSEARGRSGLAPGDAESALGVTLLPPPMHLEDFIEETAPAVRGYRRRTSSRSSGSRFGRTPVGWLAPARRPSTGGASRLRPPESPSESGVEPSRNHSVPADELVAREQARHQWRVKEAHRLRNRCEKWRGDVQRHGTPLRIPSTCPPTPSDRSTPLGLTGRTRISDRLRDVEARVLQLRGAGSDCSESSCGYGNALEAVNRLKSMLAPGRR